jgi:SAM-dependent methyltransferase
MGDVVMENWHRIWNKRCVDEKKLQSNNAKEIFMELKRLTGNDTMGPNGVKYESFMRQYNHLMEDLSNNGRWEIKSVFEVGCGSGPYLMMNQLDGRAVGGMDYSQVLIDVAGKVLKNPRELYCDEAVNLKTDEQYDAVFSTSAFEYFESEEYATKVLNKMLSKANYSIGVIDVHDAALQEQWLLYRRSTIENYDELYNGLDKMFYYKKFFEEYAEQNNLDIIIKESYLDGYWNKDYVYDVYFYRK